MTALLGESNLETLAHKNNLANLLRGMGEPAEAKRRMREVIEGNTAQLGASHAHTLTSKGNLAGFLEGMGETDEARRLFEEVIEGETAQLGASHTSTLTTKGNFAIFLANSCDLAGAIAALNPVVVGFTEQLGVEHRDTQHYANVLEQIVGMGNTSEARRQTEDVIEGKTAQLGATHTSTLASKGNFAIFLANSGDVAGAIARL